MKKKINFFLIILFLTTCVFGNAHAGKVRLFKEFIEGIPSFFDDLFKGGKNVADEAAMNTPTKSIEKIKTKLDQDIIFNKVTKDTHNYHLDQALNKSNVEIGLNHGVTISKLGKKASKYSENLFDLFDFNFSAEEKDFIISPYIQKSWTGKIYQTSEYFSKPKINKKLLLVCKNTNEIFYFTIILNNENDINRAYLTNYKFIKTYTREFPKQELLVLYDENPLKVMSTKPFTSDSYPTDYFIIHDNQFFVHDRYNNPEKIINANKNIQFKENIKDKCYKAKRDGLTG
tara:strand:- start:387 stop:1247 length:861 start_codon:yes stop_codon:yes gene_type:complete